MTDLSLPTTIAGQALLDKHFVGDWTDDRQKVSIRAGDLRQALLDIEAEILAKVRVIDPSWCDCPQVGKYGIGLYKHLPSCRYGIVEDYFDGHPAISSKS